MRLCCGPPIGGEGMNTSSLVLLGIVRTVPSSMKPSVLNDFRATPALKLGKGNIAQKWENFHDVPLIGSTEAARSRAPGILAKPLPNLHGCGSRRMLRA